MAYVPKMGHSVPACYITGQAHPSLPKTNTALKGLVLQTQISAKVCETWFGRVITPLDSRINRNFLRFKEYLAVCNFHNVSLQLHSTAKG